MLGLDRVKIVKIKVIEVLKWLVFREVNNMQKLLEQTKYYWRLVKNFAKIVKPLHEIVKKNRK